MTHKQRPRARFIPTEHGDEELRQHPEPRQRIPYPIHYWSVWKSLSWPTARDDSRIVRITDSGIIEWAAAFAEERLYWLEVHEHSEETWRREIRAHDAWQALEPRLHEADPRRAYMMMAGAAAEVMSRIAIADDNEQSQILDDLRTRLWSIYQWHFGSPEHPRMEMYL